MRTTSTLITHGRHFVIFVIFVIFGIFAVTIIVMITIVIMGAKISNSSYKELLTKLISPMLRFLG